MVALRKMTHGLYGYDLFTGESMPEGGMDGMSTDDSGDYYYYDDEDPQMATSASWMGPMPVVLACLSLIFQI